jgi:hypothetical protein
LIRKSVVLPFLAVWLSALPASGQQWAKDLFKGKLTYDLGTVARGGLAEHRFPVENIFQEDVEIESVESSCGCTKLKASKNLLKMYDTAEIIVELDTRRFVGFKEASIRVTLNFRPAGPNRRPEPGLVVLKLRAFIRGDVVFEPGVVQFDSVTPGQGAEKHVTVSYAGRRDWQILEAAGTSSELAVSFKETGRNYEPNLGATQVTYDLAVSLKGTPPPGYFKENVILKTNDQNQQTARVPLAVEGYVAAPLTVNPAMLMLGAVKPNQSVSKVLVVSGATPFHVVRVTGPDDQFSFTPAADAKKVHVIGVRFTAGNKPGKVSGKIRIATDLGDGTVDVDGQVLAADSATNDPPRIDAAKPDSTKAEGNTLRTGRLKAVEPSGEKTP